jgi:hypothetical protein
VDWVTGLLRHARELGLTRVAAKEAGVTSWTDHVRSLGVGLLSNEVDSWMTGINRNVEGQADADHRALQRQRAGVPRAVR